MKKMYKLLTVTTLFSLLFISCDLEEDPSNLSSDTLYATNQGVSVALNGVFSSFTNYFYYAHDYHCATGYTSGLFMAQRGVDRLTINAINTQPSQNYTTGVWRMSYQAISRANDLLFNVEEGSGDAELDNIIGVTYFLRAHTYFNLVRLFGGVPLRKEPTTILTTNEPRASVDDVYAQIIADCEKAQILMKDASEQSGGRPGKLAANFLLAKIYMTLAGNDNSSPYWQKAYDEAIKLYGKFSLVSNYDDLWSTPGTANHNSESIFEINFNSEVFSRIGRVFSPGNAYAGPGWQRLRAFPEVVDAHMNRYPADPRIASTFRSEYERYNVAPLGRFVTVYPSRDRRSAGNSFPYVNKFFIKDQTGLNDATDFNWGVFRYGDLLLMLAEIENELNGPGNAYQYVNEVLTRARNSDGGTTDPANWTGLSQDDFRSAIMKEYHYELLAEGEDSFNSHRRGYEFFKTNYIDVHNARNEFGFDIVLPDNEDRAMLLPIPSLEINTNTEISIEDQNPGYF